MIFKAEDRCKFCAHYIQNQTCKAFPDDIPKAIFTGDVFHDSNIDDDHGIIYQSRHLHFPDAETFLSGNYTIRS